MDFAAALANLQKTAKAAANSGNTPSSQQRRDGDRRRGRQDHDQDQRRNSRPRYNEREGDNTRDRERHGNSDKPEQGMSRFGYRVNPYRSPPDEASSDGTNAPKHIALLVICIDELPYEHIWKEWAKTGDAVVSLLVHAKYPKKIKSDWLRQRLLLHPPRIGRGDCYADPEYLTHSPEWGSVQITRAMVELVATGLKMGPTDREEDARFSTKRFLVEGKDTAPGDIPPVDKMIFVSETCLPVMTLQECEDALFEVPKAAETKEGEEDCCKPAAAATLSVARPNEVSWVSARNLNTPDTPKNKYERDQFQDIHRMVPQQFRWKADQWSVLSRPHAAAVVNMDQHMRSGDQLWNSFARINASDEMYFPTALACLGILKEDDTAAVPQVSKRAVTYTDWTEGMRNPATHTNGVRDFSKIAKIARKQGCLFARKFALFHNIPGKANVVTGEIDTGAWKEALDAIQKLETES